MIEIIIFYLLFRTTLIFGFILGYLVRGLLQLITKTKEDTAYILAREEEQLYTEALLEASDELRKVYLN